MADQKRIEPGGGKMIAKFFLASEEVHLRRVYQAEGSSRAVLDMWKGVLGLKADTAYQVLESWIGV